MRNGESLDDLGVVIVLGFSDKNSGCVFIVTRSRGIMEKRKKCMEDQCGNVC